MYSTKQSNWILGLGIIVAIIVIVSSAWLYHLPEDQGNSVENKDIPEIGQTIKQVNKGLGWLSSAIKTLN